MWTTFALVKRTTTSPSVWAGSTWITSTMSPFRCSVTESANVITGRAAAGDAGVVDLKNSLTCCALIRLPHVVVRDDHRSGLAVVLVAAGVIPVPVGVDHEAHRALRQLRHGRVDLVGERRELVVDDERAIVAHREADVAARPGEHRDAGRERRRHDLDLGKVLILGVDPDEEEARRKDGGPNQAGGAEHGGDSDVHGAALLTIAEPVVWATGASRVYCMRKMTASRPARVQLLVTCLVDRFFPDTGEAVVDVLERLGIEVEFPDAQTCCGQPAFNSGYTDEARALARHTIDVLSASDAPVVVPSGSCGDMVIHQYEALFADDPVYGPRARALSHRTYELTQFLVDVLGVTDVGATASGKLAYHACCHGLRGLDVADAADGAARGRARRRRSARCAEADVCCGFGGLFAVKMADISAGDAGAQARSHRSQRRRHRRRHRRELRHAHERRPAPPRQPRPRAPSRRRPRQPAATGEPRS